MNVRTKKATVYLDPKIHRALRIKSADTSQSMSEIVSEAIVAALAEDAEDLEAFAGRAHEPLITFEKTLKELKRDGKI